VYDCNSFLSRWSCSRGTETRVFPRHRRSHQIWKKTVAPDSYRQYNHQLPGSRYQSRPTRVAAWSRSSPSYLLYVATCVVCFCPSILPAVSPITARCVKTLVVTLVQRIFQSNQNQPGDTGKHRGFRKGMPLGHRLPSPNSLSSTPSTVRSCIHENELRTLRLYLPDTRAT